MNEDVRSLIESLRRGQYEDPTEKIDLLAAALREAQAPVDFLLSLLKAPQVPLRLAAIEAAQGRAEPPLHSALAALATDPDARVRLRLARALSDPAESRLPESLARATVEALLNDGDVGVRTEACKAARSQPSLLPRLRTLLTGDAAWSVRLAAADGLADQSDPDTLTALLTALSQDDDIDVRQRTAGLLNQRLERAAEAPPVGGSVESRVWFQAAQGLTQLPPTSYPRLRAWVQERTRSTIDPQVLARFGLDLTAQAEAGILPRAYHFEASLRPLLAMFASEAVRSIALLGPSGCGKSALVNELVHALARPENGGWRVLRMSPTDFMAGTKYLGDWESKVAQLVEAVRRPRRVLLYVPGLDELAAVGRWAKSDANVASALAPYIEEGAIVILGESTPEEFERGLGREVTLARLFDRVLLEEASVEETLGILRSIRDETKAPITDEVLTALNEMASGYLSHIGRPGSAATLLRNLIAQDHRRTQPITRRGVLEVLSASTGIPADLLDDDVPLTLGNLREFFEQRIMGQPEAVQAVLDLVTLVKAGLTDPQKPMGVLLFVGPTGVGKTELARSLAEYIFGDPQRLLRFDMSEFASPEGFTRLIGGRGENGLLTDAVRQRPFSVVLLDEIEKSHLNIFDLCLQIFDAGRLTDGRGRLIDFRRTIVILTSNIGAETPGTPLGFGHPASSAPATASSPNVEPDRDRTFRELSRFFRPEFLNRLDRIVHFRPLAPEVAERIARRELDQVLQRSGVARRHLRVRVEPAVISLLVRDGYSPHFGARPLKRTVERLVLLPLARAIADGRLATRQDLLLVVRDQRVAVEIVSRPPDPAEPSRASRGGGGTSPDRLRERVDALLDSQERLQAPLAALRERRSNLVTRTQAADFYQRPAECQATFDELHRVDQFLTRTDRWQAALGQVRARLESGAPSAISVTSLRERIEGLAAEFAQLELISHGQSTRDLSDALIEIQLAGPAEASIEAVRLLVEMYLAFAPRRQFAASVLGEQLGPGGDLAWLQVLGLGAFAQFQPESGLHEFRRRTPGHGSKGVRKGSTEETSLVAVQVFPWTGDPDPHWVRGVRIRTSPLQAPSPRWVAKPGCQVSVFDPASMRSLEGRFSGSQRSAGVLAAGVLAAQLADGAAGAASQATEIVRRYDLGIGSCIRDLRTGRSTTRISQVLRGHLELLAVRD